MTQPRALNFQGLQDVTVGDLNGMQDRIFGDMQARLAALFQSQHAAGYGPPTAQSGVISGLACSISAGLTIAIADGEAFIYDSTASGLDSPYRLIRVDSATGLPSTRTVTLAAANATNPRIDLVYAMPATGNISADAAAIVQQATTGGTYSSPTVEKLTRPSATLGVVTGTPAASPTMPALPSGAIPLCACYVPANATTPSALFDKRFFLSPGSMWSYNGNQGTTGVLTGFGVQWVSSTQFKITSGGAFVFSEWIANQSDITFTHANVHEAYQLGSPGAISSATASGIRYVYAYRRGLNPLTQTNGYAVIVSTSAPNNNTGAPGPGQLYPNATDNPVGAAVGLLPGDVIYLGRYYYDSVNGISDARSRSQDFVGSEDSAGVSAVGGATGPGVKATAGGGTTPVRGALALVSQNVPTSPSDGDIWYEGTAFKARANGVTMTLVPPSAAMLRLDARSGGDAVLALTQSAADQKLNSFTTGKQLTVGPSLTSDGFGKITCQIAGTYLVHAGMEGQATAGYLAVKLYKNGAAFAALGEAFFASGLNGATVSGVILMSLAVNDYLELYYNDGNIATNCYEAMMTVTRIA